MESITAQELGAINIQWNPSYDKIGLSSGQEILFDCNLAAAGSPQSRGKKSSLKKAGNCPKHKKYRTQRVALTFRASMKLNFGQMRSYR